MAILDGGNDLLILGTDDFTLAEGCDGTREDRHEAVDDNDGHPDLFLYGGKGALFRNLGNGKFKSVPFPKLPTVASQAEVWADYLAELEHQGLSRDP